MYSAIKDLIPTTYMALNRSIFELLYNFIPTIVISVLFYYLNSFEHKRIDIILRIYYWLFQRKFVIFVLNEILKHLTYK